MLREHKPPPIRRIRISDFGLRDPKRDPDRHQNCITWSLSHALPLQKISSKSVHKFVSNPTDRQTNRQTNRQTDRTKNITSFFGGGNKPHIILKSHTNCQMSIVYRIGLSAKTAKQLAVVELYVKSCQFFLPMCIYSTFTKISGIRKLESLSYHVALFAYMFNYSHRTMACD